MPGPYYHQFDPRRPDQITPVIDVKEARELAVDVEVTRSSAPGLPQIEVSFFLLRHSASDALGPYRFDLDKVTIPANAAKGQSWHLFWSIGAGLRIPISFGHKIQVGFERTEHEHALQIAVSVVPK